MKVKMDDPIGFFETGPGWVSSQASNEMRWQGDKRRENVFSFDKRLSCRSDGDRFPMLHPSKPEGYLLIEKNLFVRMLLEQIFGFVEADEAFYLLADSRDVAFPYGARLVSERVAGIGKNRCDFVVVEKLLEGGH